MDQHKRGLARARGKVTALASVAVVSVASLGVATMPARANGSEMVIKGTVNSARYVVHMTDGRDIRIKAGTKITTRELSLKTTGDIIIEDRVRISQMARPLDPEDGTAVGEPEDLEYDLDAAVRIESTLGAVKIGQRVRFGLRAPMAVKALRNVTIGRGTELPKGGFSGVVLSSRLGSVHAAHTSATGGRFTVDAPRGDINLKGARLYNWTESNFYVQLHAETLAQIDTTGATGRPGVNTYLQACNANYSDCSFTKLS